MATHHIRISGDDLVFSAAHFITLSSACCERLHGHNYRVAAEIEGPLGFEQYVVDFVAVRAVLKQILAELDHAVLLPAEHAAIRLSASGGQVEAAFGSRRWVFPEDECVLLPIPNTTAEMLSAHIGRRFCDALEARGEGRPTRLRIEVEECFGMAAVWELGAE